MTDTTTTKVKFYVTTVQDCTDCGRQGSAYEGPPCPTCNGAGTIEDAVELTTALQALGILTRMEQVERTASTAMRYADGLANGGI